MNCELRQMLAPTCDLQASRAPTSEITERDDALQQKPQRACIYSFVFVNLLLFMRRSLCSKWPTAKSS